MAPFGRDVVAIEPSLRPVKQSYEWLKQGVRFCFYNVFRGSWLIGVAECCCQSIDITHHYGRLQAIDVALALKASSPNATNWEEHIKFPPLWNSGLRLDQFLDTPMHQLFQGVVKTVIEMTGDWLVIGLQHSKCGSMVTEFMHDVKRLHCGYCKLEPFGGSEECTL